MPRLRILLPLVLVVGISAPAWAKTEVLKTRSGAMVHWDEGEITVGLDRSVPSRTVAPEGAKQALEAAIAAWNNVGGTAPRLRAVSGPEFQVRVRFCRGRWTGDEGDLGRAEFIADVRLGLVTSATVEFNECDHYFSAPDEVGHERFDLQAVMAHEFGHVLGLSHGSNPAALMFPTGGSGGVRSPHEEDRSALAAVYGWVPHRPAEPAAAPTPADASVQPVSAPAPVGSAGPRGARPNRDKQEPPTDVLTAVTVTRADGSSVLIYTCEPTLLPALVPAKPEPAAGPEGRKRKGARREGGSDNRSKAAQR